DLTDFQAVPHCPRQYPVVVLKLRFSAQPHHSQRRAHRPFVWRKDSPYHQHFDPFKNTLTEHWREHLQQRHNLIWQDKHWTSFVVIGMFSAYPVAFFSSTIWIKSSFLTFCAISEVSNQIENVQCFDRPSIPWSLSPT